MGMWQTKEALIDLLCEMMRVDADFAFCPQELLIDGIHELFKD
ncbi:hypothetical protein [Sporolactobacillus inulinus]|nr:hypothetical protein [Sporolactobacillus inulinus]